MHLNWVGFIKTTNDSFVMSPFHMSAGSFHHFFVTLFWIRTEHWGLVHWSQHARSRNGHQIVHYSNHASIVPRFFLSLLSLSPHNFVLLGVPCFSHSSDKNKASIILWMMFVWDNSNVLLSNVLNWTPRSNDKSPSSVSLNYFSEIIPNHFMILSSFRTVDNRQHMWWKCIHCMRRDMCQHYFTQNLFLLNQMIIIETNWLHHHDFHNNSWVVLNIINQK